MDTPDGKASGFVDIVKSWIPRRSEPSNLSRDFWMPDNSCRVCYDCDSQFTVFNRRHHCRLCGRVFCAKCAANTIPTPSDEFKTGNEELERIRVCNYCFKQWKQGLVPVDNETSVSGIGLSPSPSVTSVASTKSSCTYNSSSSTVGSTPYATGPYKRVQYNSGDSSQQSAEIDSEKTKQEIMTSPRVADHPIEDMLESSLNDVNFFANRSDGEDDVYGVYHTHYLQPCSLANDYYGSVGLDEMKHVYGPDEAHTDCRKIDSPPSQGFDASDTGKMNKPEEESDALDYVNECEPPYGESDDAEPVDFENNEPLWLPPEPEDEEDEREAILYDDDDDEGTRGEWGYLRSSNSFGSGEFRTRDRSSEEHRKAMKNVVEGHFRALVAQLLQVENLQVDDERDRENWLDIITTLSWEAATLLKPDTSKSGGMDPGGYVKVKCIPCGRRSESMVVKGVVCKKNVAHRRMTSKIDKPRFLILGGALEYQRVTNQLSSFDTLLQQEMDHLKMAVAKIDVHAPDILLVEKSVSRYAQEYLLAKDISLVLNIKRPLLERIARCTGAQIVPSIDHLTSPKLGFCDMFRVEKFTEEYVSTVHVGKKVMKTLMFFEGCPKPLGCTILLKGAHEDELKKVKHVVQYGVFAAYHLALETSFLADEGASLPVLPLKSPITVALPDKPSSIDRSISTIPGFTVPSAEKPVVPEPICEPKKSCKDPVTENHSSSKVDSTEKLEGTATGSSEGCSQTLTPRSPSVGTNQSSVPAAQSDNVLCKLSLDSFSKDEIKAHAKLNLVSSNIEEATMERNAWVCPLEAIEHVIDCNRADENALVRDNNMDRHGMTSNKQEGTRNGEVESAKEAFPPSSDHQSILVSLSTRCIWKGTVCDRAHLLRIKYYGSFDKPLGRFLRDHLFEQDYHCPSCDLPSEAHVHCYTHRQGSLTISVKKFPESLPGEQEGKIWMWHRCLRCPRINGFPPATRRIVMSDAAWGLSFGKFLELSFSNHAAASRVASCGHSLHRDCLRFYGFGRLVACFRYASISVHSVYLPPQKVEFSCDHQEWIQYEAKEVRYKAEVLADDVQDAVRMISNKIVGPSPQTSELRIHLADFETTVLKEKEDIKESLQQILNGDLKAGQPKVDLLDINRLRRRLLFDSYAWDQFLVQVASSIVKGNVPGAWSPKPWGSMSSVEKLVDMSVASKPSKDFSSLDSFPQAQAAVESNQVKSAGDISDPTRIGREMGTDVDLKSSRKETENCPASTAGIGKENHAESGHVVQRALSESNFAGMSKVSDTLDAAWADLRSPESGTLIPDLTSHGSENLTNINKSNQDEGRANEGGVEQALCSVSIPDREPICTENSTKLWMPSPSLHTSLNRISSFNSQKQVITESNPVYVTSYRDLELGSGARLLLPVGNNGIVVPVFDDEPTSIIAYALVSSDYHAQLSESDKPRSTLDSASSFSLFESMNLLSLSTFGDASFDMSRSLGSADESRVSQLLDPSFYLKDLHARVSFVDEGPLGKVKFTVTCYYATRFEALRKTCCPSELDFVRSLSRCKKWGAQGGKSNVFFAKTLDDRFIIKQVTKTELESFIKFGPEYFKYLSESISTKSPTCLAKILGIYQVSSKHFKGGKESKMDVLVMENLLFKRNVIRLYDLKGSSRSRYNADTSGDNKVLLDQNLIEAMPTSPIFVGSKAKRLLERAVWNDTSFLASIDVMDYSLLVGMDEERHELVLGIIDFMRQYTWDKHLETWVKTSGILGGAKNAPPTVISPQQYKKRFRKAMTAYFLMVPDQWSPPTIVPSNNPQTEANEDKEGSQAVVPTS